MDNDQFGGRTDDDLFADDFEPIAPENQIPILTTADSAPVTTSIPPQEKLATETEPAAIPPTQVPKSLAQSRHNRPDKPARPNNHKSNGSSSHPKPAKQPPTNSDKDTLQTPAAPSTAPKAPSAAASAPAKYVSSNTASAVSEARLGSGANPRTKLTEEELSARMEEMRLLNAKTERRFQQTQADESAHAEALLRGQEEARKRRLEEAAKKKAENEDRRRLEEERAKNRERKLNEKKEGGWDEGKNERLAEEDRRGFRSAHGGIRGSLHSGLAGSRYAHAENDDPGEHGNGSSGRARGGRGRGGRGGRGRGGKQLFDPVGDRSQDSYSGSNNDSWATRRDQEKLALGKLANKQEEFPALPSMGNGSKKVEKAVPKYPPQPSSAGKATDKLDTLTASSQPGNFATEIPLSPPIGKWDEEVEAMDARRS
ncbi:hypothetical protein QBC47DRAFT_373306 [Echria macrotheca]|uniref:Uncharacterized protein n=1 Tax=Echria macrotheca TaxID=438768 RepID=A0AAJ0BKE7_9PEZI|nr:hypothetical protein QBC47DRAFT_373306 [Echria macrotheca]